MPATWRAIRAAQAGKAIFCEKPVDLEVARSRACAEAVRQAGVTCMIGFQRRFDPTLAALKRSLDAGEIGTPEMLVITSRDPGPPPVACIARSGGVFKDMLIHVSWSATARPTRWRSNTSSMRCAMARRCAPPSRTGSRHCGWPSWPPGPGAKVARSR